MIKRSDSCFFKLKDWAILLVILGIALGLRLYKIDSPLADLHSWRQADTAAVSRNFVRDGFNLLHPRYDDLSSLQSGRENPRGYRMVEFPIYNALVAVGYLALPSVGLETWGRLVSVIFSLAAISCLYYIAAKEKDRIAGIATALVYSIFPYMVFFSRTVLPETTAVGFMVIAIFFLYLWHEENRQPVRLALLFLSAFCYASSVLIKPTTIFYSLAILVLFWRRYRMGIFRSLLFYSYFILGCLPLFLWRRFILSYPEGIPASSWLITSVNTFEGQKNIFFKPAFFRWVFFERINNLIFGGYSLFFAILGAVTKSRKILAHAVFFSAMAYLLVFQGGNVQHEYYQIVTFPGLALITGIGISLFLGREKDVLLKFVRVITLLAVIALSVFFSWYKVKDYYNTPNDLVQIAGIISTLTPKSDKIVTDRMGDTTLLYLADRKGSPANYKSLEEFKQMGYSWYVTANTAEINNLKTSRKYPLVFENNQFALFRL